MCKLFKKKLQEALGEEWKGTKVYDDWINKLNKKKLYPDEKDKVKTGNVDEWDITLLSTCLVSPDLFDSKSSAFTERKSAIVAIREVRNGHYHAVSMTKKKFNDAMDILKCQYKILRWETERLEKMLTGRWLYLHILI